MKPTYHIVSHSHWDREWYFPFDRFRAMLVDMVEDLLELFERNPEFKSYTLDGQMAALMDYLEIRPDRAQRIRELVEAKKLFIGPWYILNDEFLSSGESDIRNLLFGFRLGMPLGGVMKVGYMPDQFGHIAQMPQILRGFDIDTAMIYRGFGGERGQELSEYWWVSPDGTRVLMHHLPKDGYSAGYFGTEDEQIILQKFERIRRELDRRATSSQRLFFNGGDHHWPDGAVTTAIEVLRKHHDAEMVHGNFVDYFDALKKEIKGGENLPQLRGETRFGYRHAFAVLGGVFSSRMYLKQFNAECQTMLERQLEPLNVLASLQGMRSKTPQIEQAWKYVIQNQDHDAICGTSVDEVHQEMVVRYKKAKQIGEHVKAECFAQLLPYDEAAHEDERYVFVFNPSPFIRSDVLETNIEFYLQDVVVGLNPEVKVADKALPIKGFKLLDARGNDVSYQILNREEAFGLTYSKHDYPHQTLVDRFSILVAADDVPPLGWKGLKVVAAEAFPHYSSLVRSGEFFIENDFLRVETQADGMVRIVHKATETLYQPMNLFEDSGDVGDEYTYSYPEKDEWFYSHQFPARTCLLEQGPLRAALKIEHRMQLPQSASVDEKRRSSEKKELLITTVLSLTSRSRRLDVKTTVHNTISDHRLRVLFATGVDTSRSLAETPFAVVEREHRDYDVSQFPFEHPARVAPMQRFVTIRDARKGFTLIVKGLPEYELKLDDRGTLALTLLRCVGKLSGSNLITRPGGAAGWWNETPEAQCPGTHTFEYSLYPHAPSEAETWSSILKEVEECTVPPLVIKRKNDQNNLETSFLSIHPDHLLLSALKEADDRNGVILRLCNPVALETEGTIHFQRTLQEAHLTKLNEENIESLNIDGGHELRITAKPYQIVTIKLKF